MNETDKDTQPAIEAEHMEFDTASLATPVMAGHAWRQRGVVVACTSCPFEHSFMVEPNLTLTGLDDDGYPQFVRHE